MTTPVPQFALLCLLSITCLVGCPSKSGTTGAGGGPVGKSKTAGESTAEAALNLDPSTPDGAVRHVIQGINERKLRALWDFLPPSFQGDLDDLVHTFALKMDPEIWDRVNRVVRKSARVLRDKEQWLKTPAAHAPTQPGAPAAIDEQVSYPAVAALLESLVEGDLGDLQRLQKVRLGDWCDREGERLLRQVQLFATVRPGNPLAQTMTALSDLNINVRNVDGDEATVEISVQGESPLEVAYTRIEGRWIPRDLADQWIEAIGESRAWLSVALAPDNLSEAKPRILAALGTVDEWLDRLQKSESKETFDFAWTQGLHNVMTVAASFGPGEAADDLGNPSADLQPVPLVKVVVVGRLTAEQQDSLLDRMARLTDGGGGDPFREFSEGSATTSFTLGPVADVEEFSRKLDFLDVSKIDVAARMIQAAPKQR